MIVGSNTVFEHDGQKFHLQAEDLGLDAAAFEIRVYDAGSVLFQKRIGYQEIVDQDLSKAEFETALRTKMEKMLRTVEAAIVKGKIP